MYRERLVLAGDAAHAMLPHLGQGAAQSIEDAAALGIMFQNMTVGGENGSVKQSIEARLKLFDGIRKDRNTAIQILSEVLVPGQEIDYDQMTEKLERVLPGRELPST